MVNHLLNGILLRDGRNLIMKSIGSISIVRIKCKLFLYPRLQVYTPSDQVLKQIVRDDWKIRGGTMVKSIFMLVTPKVQVNR